MFRVKKTDLSDSCFVWSVTGNCRMSNNVHRLSDYNITAVQQAIVYPAVSHFWFYSFLVRDWQTFFLKLAKHENCNHWSVFFSQSQQVLTFSSSSFVHNRSWRPKPYGSMYLFSYHECGNLRAVFCLAFVSLFLSEPWKHIVYYSSAVFPLLFFLFVLSYRSFNTRQCHWLIDFYSEAMLAALLDCWIVGDVDLLTFCGFTFD